MDATRRGGIDKPPDAPQPFAELRGGKGGSVALDYHAPRHLDEALHLIQGRRMAIVAGGTDVYPAGGPDRGVAGIVDLTRIAGLRGIARTDEGGWRIGAATTWTEIARADLPPAFAGLQAAAREVGGVQIQNAGTLAGNLCNASPAADGVPPLLTLDAEVEVAGPHGTRRQPLDQFITGVRKTTLGQGEIVTALYLPLLPEDAVGAFGKLGARRYLVISILMTAVIVAVDSAGRIATARVAIGACSPVALRLPELEAALSGQPVKDPDVPPDLLTPLAPITDIRADAAYRLEAVATQIRRALAAAATNG